MKRFKNRNILITGGSRGIGRAIVSRFIKEGARVFFIYNSSEDEAKKFIKELNTALINPYKLDVRDYKKAVRVVNGIVKEYGYIDILVNNAGITRDCAINEMKYNDFKDVVDTNLFGTFNLVRAVIPHLISRRKGKIINISSVSAVRGVPHQVNYSASKAAILGFTRSLAREVARYNINVNAILPGFIQTDMFDKLNAFSKSAALKNIPLRRVGKPAEVAGLAAYLSSKEAAYITGQIFVIDGGISI